MKTAFNFANEASRHTFINQIKSISVYRLLEIGHVMDNFEENDHFILSTDGTFVNTRDMSPTDANMGLVLMGLFGTPLSIQGNRASERLSLDDLAPYWSFIRDSELLYSAYRASEKIGAYCEAELQVVPTITWNAQRFESIGRYYCNMLYGTRVTLDNMMRMREVIIDELLK